LSSPDTEKDEKIIADYCERARTLQRNYLMMIALALGFLLLYSFPFFSAQQSLKDVTETKNSLIKLRNTISSQNQSVPRDIWEALSNVNKTIPMLERTISETDITLALNSPLGTVKIGFIQILIFYPMALAIGFVILCLQLEELLRYSKWVNNNPSPTLSNELKHRAPGIIRVEYWPHVIMFISLPFLMLIFSVGLDLYAIFSLNTKLGGLYTYSGQLYQFGINVLYVVSVVSSCFLIFFVCRERYRLYESNNHGSQAQPKRT
jgi:hypothetical protein